MSEYNLHDFTSLLSEFKDYPLMIDYYDSEWEMSDYTICWGIDERYPDEWNYIGYIEEGYAVIDNYLFVNVEIGTGATMTMIFNKYKGNITL